MKLGGFPVSIRDFTVLRKEFFFEQLFIFDGIVQIVDQDNPYTYDGDVQGAEEKSYTFDADVFGTAESSFSFDAIVARSANPTNSLSFGTYHVLVDVDWPGGARHYGDISVVAEGIPYDGRLCEIGDITLGTNGRKDSTTFRLENTPKGATVESLWSDTNPPEGAEVRVYYWFPEAPVDDRYEVFRGIVDQVQEINEDTILVSALSIEEFNAAEIGTDIAITEFPDAPAESIGKIKPIVFGTIPEFETVPITEVGRTALSATALAADTSLVCEDVSRIADATPTAPGSVRLAGETITYTGRNTATNTLTGCSVRTKDYAAGEVILEVTSLVVMVASHPCQAVTDVYAAKGQRLRKMAGTEYAIDLTGPTKVTMAAGWPTVPIPGGSSTFAQLQFDAADGSNTATNPLNACGEAAGWLEGNYAQVPATKTLAVTQTSDVPDVGTILRAYAMVEYDPATVAAAPTGSSTDRHELREGANVLGFLTQAGNLPSDLKNRANALGITRAYDDPNTVVDPAHTHPAGAVTSYFQQLDTVDVLTGSFISGAGGGGPTVDGNFVESAYVPSSNANINWRLTKIPEGQSKGDPYKVRFGIDGRDGVGAKTVSFYINNVFQGSVTLTAARQTLTSSYFSFSSWADLTAATTSVRVVGLNADTAAGGIYEVWYDVQYYPSASTSATQNSTLAVADPLRHTVAFLADVTALAAGSWAWFKNRVLSLLAFSTAPTAFVVRICFVIEYTAVQDEPADRILVDVQGLVYNGLPTEILKSILTSPYLLGLAGTPYSLVDFDNAALDLAVMGVVQETFRPDGTSANTLTLTGAATLHAALSDVLDTSYAGWSSSAGTSKTGTVTLGTYTKGVNDFIVQVELHARIYGLGNGVVTTVALKDGATTRASIVKNVTTLQEFTATWESGDLSQATLNALTLDVTVVAGDGSITGEGRVYEAWLIVNHYGGQFRMDFALKERITGAELVTKVCAQARLMYWYDVGLLTVSHLDDPDRIGIPDASFALLSIDDDTVKRERTPFSEVITKQTFRYSYSYRESRLSGSITVSRNTTIRRDNPQAADAELIRDLGSALSLAYSRIRRNGIPRTRLEFGVGLIGIDVLRSMIVEITTNRFHYLKVEVEETSIKGNEVIIRGPVWDSI